MNNKSKNNQTNTRWNNNSCLLLFPLYFSLFSVGFAQNAPQNTAQNTAPPAPASAASLAAPSVPDTLEEAKTFAEVGLFLRSKAQELQQDTVTPPEKLAAIFCETQFAAGERLIKIAQDDAEKAQGFSLMCSALLEMIFKDVQGAEQKIAPLFKEIEGSNLAVAPQFIRALRSHLFVIAIGKAAGVSLDTFDRFNGKMLEWLESAGISLADILALTAEVEKRKNLAPDVFVKDMAEHFRSDKVSVSEEKKKEAVNLLESVRRLALGNTPKLYGRALDDKEFKWESFQEKGKEKYVLVQFTATWCQPCQMEIPGLLEAYEKYKDKGFEIVSVYIFQDDSEFFRNAVDPVTTVKDFVAEKKTPWIILSEELATKAGLPDYATHYNILGVPTMVLADKEGKIIMQDARNMGLLPNALKNKLAEIFE